MISEEFANLVTPVFDLLRVKIPDATLIKAFTIDEPKIYINEWDSSLSRMFISIKETIKERSDRDIYVIYLIDSHKFQGIPYQQIDFANYIAF